MVLIEFWGARPEILARHRINLCSVSLEIAFEHQVAVLAAWFIYVCHFYWRSPATEGVTITYSGALST